MVDLKKNIHIDKLSFKYSGTLDPQEVLSDDTISLFTQNNANLKEFKIENISTSFTVNKMLFPCIAMFALK